MNVDATLVRHIASLANLQLTEEELKHYETQLGNILGYVAQLNELKVGTEPTYSTAATPERDDKVVTSLKVERVMAEAPQKVGTAFQVPRILD